MADKSVCISIISGGKINVNTIACLIDLLNQTPHPKDLFMPVGGYAAYNRNMAAKRALENKANYLMFIDADMIFPPTGVNKLMEADKDIILAAYNTRGFLDKHIEKDGEHITVATTIKMKRNGKYIGVDAGKLPKDRIFEVAGGGTGFMLIKTEIFNKLPYPWFVASEEGGRDWTTEDIYFCELAKENGFKIWCDPSLKIGHEGTYIY